MRIIALFALIAILAACTEKTPIAPQYTDDANWAPVITLIGSGYQRFGITIEKPPNQQIERNILRYVVEYRPPGNTDFVSLDTASSVRFLPSGYDTPQPFLQEGEEYSVRLVAEYHNGARRESNVLTFISPITRGKVLRRLPKPEEAQSTTVAGFGFYDGDLFAMLENQLFRVDTASGNAGLVKTFETAFFPHQIAFHSEHLIVAHPTLLFGTVLVQRFNLNTSSFENDLLLELGLDLSGEARLEGIAVGSRYVYATTSTFAPYLQQLHIADLVSGQTVFTSAKLEPVLNRFILVEDALWTAIAASAFDYRVRGFDPLTLTLQNDFQNPIYPGYTLAWDGAHFWTWDTRTQTFAELELDGL